ncbi:MAG TPA: hypothetical protein VM802_28090 [Chitinophaga sp.]|uniref:HYC_CC_PP family protein n=1 Tax=Chitinophaga sp. TaxID=1869181 RepID=UPI002C1D0B90|nr:hypothetical protein [Chitinophaga sp.]HVI48762.1 hypothetical protein [Chitinophaga sp.]
MKKALALILALFYVATSTGATIHMHYCMGKLMEVEVWNAKVKKCEKCGASSYHSKMCAKKCCRDEHKTVKLEKDQQAAAHVSWLMQAAAIATPVSFIEFAQPHTVPLAVEYPTGLAPPRSSHVPVHIMNCTFRI